MHPGIKRRATNMPREPDYKRPFATEDFRGYFKWTKVLSRRLQSDLYHACHWDELLEIVEDESLELRSKWSLKLPAHGLYAVPGSWTGLNYYNRGNHYGPFLITFSLSVLNGRSFMVFHRKDVDRHRHFFVQYEAKIPVYSFRKKLWRIVKPSFYFNESDDKKLNLKRGAIYDIIITEPIPIRNATIEGVNHPHCIPEKCDGMTSSRSTKFIKRLAKRQFKEYLKESRFYERFIDQFPDLEGEKIILPSLE